MKKKNHVKKLYLSCGFVLFQGVPPQTNVFSIFLCVHVLNSKSYYKGIFIALCSSSHNFQEHSACENSQFADSFSCEDHYQDGWEMSHLPPMLMLQITVGWQGYSSQKSCSCVAPSSCAAWLPIDICFVFFSISALSLCLSGLELSPETILCVIFFKSWMHHSSVVFL